MSKEIWIKIEGYDDYFISNEGRVMNTKYNKIKYLKPGRNQKGYLHVSLCKNNKGKTHTIHRLVAEAFIDNPNNYPQIDHIDGNRANNDISNLRWVTNQQNCFNQKDVRGYSWDKNRDKWKAAIMLDGKLFHLGRFNTEEEAREAYLKAKEVYHIIE